MSAFHVAQVWDGPRRRWAVYKGHKQVSRMFANQMAADRMAVRMEREARHGKPQERPCLCCGRVFRSDGRHNRLCAVCGTGSQPVVV